MVHKLAYSIAMAFDYFGSMHGAMENIQHERLTQRINKF
jgi:hypothetical protein